MGWPDGQNVGNAQGDPMTQIKIKYKSYLTGLNGQ